MKKILIVDDSAFMRTVLKDLLTDKSEEPYVLEVLELYEADGKKSALKQLVQIKPDLILLDIVMKDSEIEGVEFVREIKDFFDMEKIIIISSVGQVSVLDECRQLGVTRYLQKPFEKDNVVSAVNDVLG